MKKSAPVNVEDPIQRAVFNAFEAALDAQLRAIRRLRHPDSEKQSRAPKSMSQVDMVYDVLRMAGKPLHISEILQRIEKTFGKQLDRESVVSSLVKKVRRQDRFVRTDRNVFALRQGA
jgi:macrodomain Ter protein organizer (MatP/YcbG family)